MNVAYAASLSFAFPSSALLGNIDKFCVLTACGDRQPELSKIRRCTFNPFQRFIFRSMVANAAS